MLRLLPALLLLSIGCHQSITVLLPDGSTNDGGAGNWGDLLIPVIVTQQSAVA